MGWGWKTAMAREKMLLTDLAGSPSRVPSGLRDALQPKKSGWRYILILHLISHW